MNGDGKESIEQSDFITYRIIDKRGIQIENLHPSDEGVYECRAENKMGSVTTSVKVVVQERPVLTVTPENRVQVGIPDFAVPVIIAGTFSLRN